MPPLVLDITSSDGVNNYNGNRYQKPNCRWTATSGMYIFRSCKMPEPVLCLQTARKRLYAGFQIIEKHLKMSCTFVVLLYFCAKQSPGNIRTSTLSKFFCRSSGPIILCWIPACGGKTIEGYKVKKGTVINHNELSLSPMLNAARIRFVQACLSCPVQEQIFRYSGYTPCTCRQKP